MNIKRTLISLGLALVIGLIAAVLVYHQLKRAGSGKAVPSQQIVVAARAMPLGTMLDASDLRVIPWPSEDALVGSFSNPKDCAGRALMAPVAENEPILEAKLAPRQAGAGLPAAIPVGMRAISVPVNDVVAVAGFVTPGTMVDVLVTGQATNGSRQDSMTRTVLEDVRVLAAGEKVEQDQTGKPAPVSVVTLLVTPEQANKLTMAATEGQIHLTLRNTIDPSIIEAPPIYRDNLFQLPRQPVAVARPAAPAVKQRDTGPKPYEVEIIRGDKRVMEPFPNQPVKNDPNR
ncbi:MAG: Flp pilus assembly protein CpaB [Terriglobia bacterium]